MKHRKSLSKSLKKNAKKQVKKTGKSHLRKKNKNKTRKRNSNASGVNASPRPNVSGAIQWIGKNPNATREQFREYMKNIIKKQ